MQKYVRTHAYARAYARRAYCAYARAYRAYARAYARYARAYAHEIRAYARAYACVRTRYFPYEPITAHPPTMPRAFPRHCTLHTLPHHYTLSQFS